MLSALRWIALNRKINCLIVTDCLSALQVLEQVDFKGHYLVSKIIILLQNNLANTGLFICFLWVANHCGIGRNEYVDYLANLSSNFRSTDNQYGDIQVKLTSNKISIADAPKVAREIYSDLRNRQYLNNATGAHYKQFFPTINNEIPINNNGSGTILRLQTGHCKFNSH